MFRFLKYLFVMNRLRHAKNALVVLVGSVAVLVLFVFIASDLSAHLSADQQFGWMAIKWSVIITLIALMGWSAKRVFSLFTAPFGKYQAVHDRTKNALLAKAHLLSKEERILQKYRQENQ